MNKKLYVVTDPCYLVANRGAWNSFCEMIDCLDLTVDQVSAEAEKYLTEYLGTPVKVADTGYGDWSNSISCVSDVWDKNVLKSEFCADSGLVCVAELTDDVRENYRKSCGQDILSNRYSVAVLELAGIEHIEFDTRNPDWTVITIVDTDGDAYSSEEYDEHFGYPVDNNW